MDKIELTLDHHEPISDDCAEAEAEITRLRTALELAIRSHENLLDLRALPTSFEPECRRILTELRAAHTGAM